MEEGRVIKISREIYDYLMEKHNKDSEFRFRPRTMNVDERLDKGYLFRGNANYISLTFYMGSCWYTKSSNISFQIGEDNCSIYLIVDNKDKTEIDLVKEVVFSLENKLKIKFDDFSNNYRVMYRWRYAIYDGNNYMECLKDFIANKKPIIDEVVDKYQSKNLRRITEKEFDGFIKKVSKHINNKRDIKLNNSKYVEQLLHCKNIILTGAPGTGKTYLANQIAKQVIGDDGNFEEQIGFVQFHPSYDYTDFVEGLRPSKDENDSEIKFSRQNGIFKEFCKKAIIANEKINAKSDNFDEAWDKLCNYIDENEYYEIVGEKGGVHQYRVSNKRNSLVRFNVGSGNYSILYDQLYKIYKNPEDKTYYKGKVNKIINFMRTDCGLLDYKKGDNLKDKKFVFIIDEINRGEISKIFGELFYGIEAGYRGEDYRIQTQYQNMIDKGDVFEKGFFIPSNVYIIGTMNDIDRSVESIDFAMRRRFAWIEIKPEHVCDDMWKDKNTGNSYEWSKVAKEKMNALNNVILDIDGLGEEYAIGPAYFLKLNDYDCDLDEKFELLWKNNIEPVLNEYLRGYKEKDETKENLFNAFFEEIEENSNQEE